MLGRTERDLFGQVCITYVPTIYSPMNALLLAKKWLLAEYVRVGKNPVVSSLAAKWTTSTLGQYTECRVLA